MPVNMRFLAAVGGLAGALALHSLQGTTPGAPATGLSASHPDAGRQPGACSAAHATPIYTKPADDGVALGSLLEGAGYGSSSNSDWVDLAAGNLCGGPEKELILLKNQHSYFSVLRGPAPYAVGTGALTSNPAHPWRAVATGNLDGGTDDEIVAVRKVTAAGVPDVVVAKAAASACDVSAVIAVATVGNRSNSDWLDAAVGDFDGTGAKQIALLKAAHSNLFLLKLSAPGSLTTVHATDLDSDPNQPWRALAAGDIDGDQVDELIVARQVTDGAGATVLAYKWTGSEFQRLATSTFGNTGNSNWSSAAVGDFNGDGRKAIVLVKNSHSNFAVLDLEPGATELRILSTADLDSVEGQRWRGVAAVDWLSGSDQGASELVAVRAARHPYETDLFVYGDPFHRLGRDTGLERTKGQWDQARGTTAAQLKAWLAETHTTTMNWQLALPGDYPALVDFLAATKDFCVDGQQLRVWITLYTPRGMGLEQCSLPRDSTVTPWNELDYFRTEGGVWDVCGRKEEIPGPGGEPIEQIVTCDYCKDYLGWTSMIGRLAGDYPHLVALGIDDFNTFLADFSSEYLAEMQSRMRSQASWLNFVPTLYYLDMMPGDEEARRWPDIARTFDTILMYFRNEKRGEGPCSLCEGHTSRSGCLDGVCAEGTVKHSPEEIADMSAFLPAGRTLQVGIYFARHGTLGEPSIRYDYDLVTLAQSLSSIGGTTVYAMQTPTIACTGTNFLDDKYCALAKAYGDKPPSVTHADLTNASPGSPLASGTAFGYVFDAQGGQNIVFRAANGQGYELWRTLWGIGHSDLTSLGQAPAAAGDLAAYMDTATGNHIVVYRATDSKIHGLSWSTGAVGHDNLSGSANAPDAAGDPVGYYNRATAANHVFYRSADRHLQLLYWEGIGAVTHADLSAGVVAPLALGDPSTSFDTTRGTNVVMYRGTDEHVHSLYWSTGGTAHDNLSASAGAPRAQGDPVPYYTPHNDAQQVVYQGVDGHVHELWWVGQAAVTGWNLTAAAGAPPSASNPAAYYSPQSNTKHVVYRSSDGHLHEISWTPGGIPGHVDLTLVAGAPTAVGHPSAYVAPHDGSHHVIYRAFNGHLNELRWVR